MTQAHRALTLAAVCGLVLALPAESGARRGAYRPSPSAPEALNKSRDWWRQKVHGLSKQPFEKRLRFWILSRVGTPYALGHLGEEQFPDKDPVFAVDKADCTTYVLTSTALAQSTDFSQARDRMETLNYRCQGVWCPVTYENRLHFTEDRINGGSASFQNLTTAIKAPREAFETIKMVLNRKADGAPLLNLHWERPITLTYIRTPYLSADILKQLPDLVGVAFIRKRYFTNGLAVAHEGFLLDKKTLVHASSDTKKVAKMDLMAYLKPSGSEFKHDGVMFFRILPGNIPQRDPLLQMNH